MDIEYNGRIFASSKRVLFVFLHSLDYWIRWFGLGSTCIRMDHYCKEKGMGLHCQINFYFRNIFLDVFPK